MPEEEKSSGKESEPRPEKQASEQDQRFFEGKASRAGEEGVFLQPTGSHDTDPFVNPPSQPEASNPSPSSAAEPGEASPANEAPAAPTSAGDGSSDSE